MEFFTSKNLQHRHSNFGFTSFKCTLCQQRIFHKRGLTLGLCTNCINGLEPVIYSKKLATNLAYSFSFFALYSYKSSIKKMICSLKFYRDLRVAKSLSALLLENMDFSFEADLIVPVPSHPIEEIKRGFFHMGYLAFLISKKINIPLYDGLRRKFFPFFRRTQKSRSRHHRIKKGLNLYIKKKELIKDKKIFLIDDVTTTGTSIKTCADLLLENGAKKVQAICIALSPF
jgi:ComF family protein